MYSILTGFTPVTRSLLEMIDFTTSLLDSIICEHLDQIRSFHSIPIGNEWFHNIFIEFDHCQNVLTEFTHFRMSLLDLIISQHLYWIRSFHSIFKGFTHVTTSWLDSILSQDLYWNHSFHSIFIEIRSCHNILIGITHFTRCCEIGFNPFHKMLWNGFDHFTTSLLDSFMSQHLYWIQSFHNIFIGFNNFWTSLLDSIISQHP